MIRLIDVKHKLGILQDVHPEAQRQTAQRERNETFQKTCAARRPEGTSSTEIRRLPVGFPDVQRVRVCDAPLVRLLLQEVKEVFNGQGGAFRRDAEDGLEEVIQELLQSPLWRRRTERAVEISNWFLRLTWVTARGDRTTTRMSGGQRRLLRFTLVDSRRVR